MKKQIIIPIIGILTIAIIFLLSEIFGYTTITNINQKDVVEEKVNDSCGYYLNRAVEFTIDTLARMEEYKKVKESEIDSCLERNIELVKQLDVNKNLPNWRTKYNDMEVRFIKVEKENYQLMLENSQLKDSPPIVNHKIFEKYTVGSEVMYISDSIIYDKNNKTYIHLEIPYLVNYYENGEPINPPDGLYTEVIYSEPNFKVHQDISIFNVITEENGKLVSKAVTEHPNITLHNEETFFNISKKRIKQLVRKIDPESKVLDVK